MNDKKRVRLLIVDDQRSIRALLHSTVSQMGAEVVAEAENGQEAIQFYQQHLPHIVLMDINMPQMDGVAALEAIMQINPNALVIMLTSQNDASVIETCLSLGARHFLLKDNPPDVIQQEIKDTWKAYLQETREQT